MFVHIVVRVKHGILGEQQAEGAQLEIHRPVAEDLAGRGIVDIIEDEPSHTSADDLDDRDDLIVE